MTMWLILFSRSQAPALVENLEEGGGGGLPESEWEGYAVPHLLLELYAEPEADLERRGLLGLAGAAIPIDDLASVLADEHPSWPEGPWVPIGEFPAALEALAAQLEAGPAALDPLLRRAVEPRHWQSEAERDQRREGNRKTLAQELREFVTAMRGLQSAGEQDMLLVFN